MKHPVAGNKPTLIHNIYWYCPGELKTINARQPQLKLTSFFAKYIKYQLQKASPVKPVLGTAQP